MKKHCSRGHEWDDEAVAGGIANSGSSGILIDAYGKKTELLCWLCLIEFAAESLGVVEDGPLPKGVSSG